MAEKTTSIYDSAITDRRELQNLVTEEKKVVVAAAVNSCEAARGGNKVSQRLFVAPSSPAELKAFIYLFCYFHVKSGHIWSGAAGTSFRMHMCILHADGMNNVHNK